MRQGGTLVPAAYGRCLAAGGGTSTPRAAPRRSAAAGERLRCHQAARLILTLAVGSWGLVGLAVWYASG